MLTQVEICNLALQLVGAKGIAAFGESTEQGRVCSTLYDPTRRELLRTHLWRFARKRASLTADPTAPTWGYDTAFVLPADCLMVAAIDSGRISTRGVRWSVEGANIVANTAGPLNILYAEDVTDPALFDPLFDQVFAHLLAVYMCEPLTQDNSKKQVLYGELNRVYTNAMASDAVETLEMVEADGTWITSRYYTGGTVDPTIVWDAWVW